MGQVSTEQWEKRLPLIRQFFLLKKADEVIYVQCVIWEVAAWTNPKTEQVFIIFDLQTVTDWKSLKGSI